MPFFVMTKLSMEVLTIIWAIADHDSTGSLNLQKFYVALRLISIAQSGRNVTSDAIRSTWDMPLDFPKFEGIETPEENAPALSVQELSTKENPGKDLKAGSTLKDTAVKLEVDNNMEVDKTKIHTSIVKDSGQTVEENGENLQRESEKFNTKNEAKGSNDFENNGFGEGFDNGGFDTEGFGNGSFDNGGFDDGGFDDGGFDNGGFENDGKDVAAGEKQALETDGMASFGDDKVIDTHFKSNGGSQDWNDNSTSAEWNHNEIAKPANEDDSWGNGSNSMSFDATFGESSANGPTHTGEANIPMNESKKGDEAGSQSASLTSQTTPPGQLAFTLVLQTRQLKALTKRKAKRKKEKKEKKKKSKKKKSKNAAAPDTKKADEEENRSNQFEVKEVDPNIVVDLKASTKSAVVDNEGTAVDIDQPTSFTQEFKEIISPSTPSNNSEVSQNSAVSNEEGNRTM